MLEGIFYVFLMITAGYLLIRGGCLPEDGSRLLSSLLMNLCFPAMILKGFSSTEPGELLSAGLPTVLITVLCSLLPALILSLRRNKGPHHSLYSFICGIGNVSFVCIPLLKLFLTQAEMVTVYLHVSIQDLLIWALFHPAFAGSHRPKQWRSLLTEPCLVAVFLGLFLCFTGISLPSFLSGPVEALDACVSPLALVFLGMTIGQYGFRFSGMGRSPVFYSLYKVIAYPAVIFLILLFCLPLKEALLFGILLGAPAPVASVVWMQKYTEDPSPAIACLIPSTLLYFLLYTPLLLFLCACNILG